MDEFDRGILNLDAPVIFFPVRHHSPAAARILKQLALAVRPAAILIEGPSDFSDRIPEFFLPHQLPIAIYTYVQFATGGRRGAFYPFCVYSPEWQALQLAHDLAIPARFIDLPWAEMATQDATSHRYADGELRFSGYVNRLCQKLGVEDFNTLWDTLFEIDPHLTPAQYLERCHQFCFHLRLTDAHIPDSDLQREAFMAAQIRAAQAEFPGQLLVVTGGFHSHALYQRVLQELEPPPVAASEPPPLLNRGIALTPYSYQRLDSLTGYESGMPNPGFYQAVWQQRAEATGEEAIAIHRQILAQVATALRERKQTASSADLIAVEAVAQGLAALRGHAEIWRQDLIDGIIGALVKEELEDGYSHPFLAALYEVLRGSDRGHLAAGTTLPPFVQDLHQQLHDCDLEPTMAERTVKLELNPSQKSSQTPTPLQKSRLLHSLRVLGISGFQRTGGSDWVNRCDMLQLWEQWQIRWTPEYESACIEASIYGSTVTDATTEKLIELSQSIERNAERAALLLLDACWVGLETLADQLYQRLVELIRQDGDFLTTSKALSHLLYLYRYDEILGANGQRDIAALLLETFQRCLWLLEGLGQVQGMDQTLLQSISTLLETFEACTPSLDLNREEFVLVLQRISTDPHQTPLLQGAIAGVLWTLGEATMSQLLEQLTYTANPSRLGDFLTGLFYLARETAQRHPELVQSIDRLLLGYDDEAFLEALPSMRLAFSYFTPREKHYMVRTLLKSTAPSATPEADEEAPLPDLEVSPEIAAQVMAFELRLFKTVERYGLRGSQPDER